MKLSPGDNFDGNAALEPVERRGWVGWYVALNPSRGGALPLHGGPGLLAASRRWRSKTSGLFCKRTGWNAGRGGKPLADGPLAEREAVAPRLSTLAGIRLGTLQDMLAGLGGTL
ncbi:MAG: hypothetical protein LBT22_06730 [Peptococcaceae bacterium]|nr:hypothetical protein [Peptococcaceae bacterium]